jgi:hypothetical protein
LRDTDALAADSNKVNQVNTVLPFAQLKIAQRFNAERPHREETESL